MRKRIILCITIMVLMLTGCYSISSVSLPMLSSATALSSAETTVVSTVASTAASSTDASQAVSPSQTVSVQPSRALSSSQKAVAAVSSKNTVSASSKAVSSASATTPSKAMTYQQELTQKQLELIKIKEEYATARAEKEFEIKFMEESYKHIVYMTPTTTSSMLMMNLTRKQQELEQLIKDYEAKIYAIEIRIAELEAMIKYNVPQS